MESNITNLQDKIQKLIDQYTLATKKVEELKKKSATGWRKFATDCSNSNQAAKQQENRRKNIRHCRMNIILGKTGKGKELQKILASLESVAEGAIKKIGTDCLPLTKKRINDGIGGSGNIWRRFRLRSDDPDRTKKRVADEINNQIDALSKHYDNLDFTKLLLLICLQQQEEVLTLGDKNRAFLNSELNAWNQMFTKNNAIINACRIRDMSLHKSYYDFGRRAMYGMRASCSGYIKLKR